MSYSDTKCCLYEKKFDVKKKGGGGGGQGQHLRKKGKKKGSNIGSCPQVPVAEMLNFTVT